MKRVARTSTLVILMLFAMLTFAQSGVGVSPPRVELSAVPGVRLDNSVSIDNPSSTASLQVDVSALDMLLDPDGGLLWLAPGSHENSLTDWLNFNPVRFELDPRESRSVSYSVSVPPDATPGTYWGVLFFESQAADEEDDGPEGLAIESRVRVAHLVYVTVGDPEMAGRIVGIRYEPGELRLTFQNEGEGLLRLDGRVEVRSTIGDLLQTLTLDGVASYPGATHDLNVPLERSLPGGEYIVLAVLDYGEPTLIAADARVSVQ